MFAGASSLSPRAASTAAPTTRPRLLLSLYMVVRRADGAGQSCSTSPTPRGIDLSTWSRSSSSVAAVPMLLTAPRRRGHLRPRGRPACSLPAVAAGRRRTVGVGMGTSGLFSMAPVSMRTRKGAGRSPRSDLHGRVTLGGVALQCRSGRLSDRLDRASGDRHDACSNRPSLCYHRR